MLNYFKAIICLFIGGGNPGHIAILGYPLPENPDEMCLLSLKYEILKRVRLITALFHQKCSFSLFISVLSFLFSVI